MNKSPTPKQKLAAKKVLENLQKDKPLSTGKVLENVGYSKHLAKQPGRIIESIGVQKALGELIPDSLLEEKHLALLNKQEVRIKNNMTTGEIDVIPTGEIDAQAVAKGLDMAYKLKGAYAPEKEPEKSIVTYNFILNPTFQAKIKPFEDLLKEQLKNVQPNQTTENIMEADAQEQGSPESPRTSEQGDTGLST